MEGKGAVGYMGPRDVILLMTTSAQPWEWGEAPLELDSPSDGPHLAQHARPLSQQVAQGRGLTLGAMPFAHSPPWDTIR